MLCALAPPKTFDVSGVIMISGLSKARYCLFNVPGGYPVNVTEFDNSIINLHNDPGENDSNHKSPKERQINKWC